MSPARTREVVALVTVFGTWLMLPPMLTMMNEATDLVGIPGIVVYLFVSWLGLILATAVIGQRLGADKREPDLGLEPISPGDQVRRATGPGGAGRETAEGSSPLDDGGLR